MNSRVALSWRMYFCTCAICRQATFATKNIWRFFATAVVPAGTSIAAGFRPRHRECWPSIAARRRRISLLGAGALPLPLCCRSPGIIMMEDGLVAGAHGSLLRAPLPHEAWQLKPRQPLKRKHDVCDLSPRSECEDYTSPDSATAVLPTAPMPPQSAQQTTTTKSSMLSPFLGGMSMRADATPGIGMTGRMGSRGMPSSAPPTVTAACNFSRRQGKSASFAPLAPGVPRRPPTGLLSGLPVAAPRDPGGSMMMSD